MGLWFGVVAGGTGNRKKKEVAFGNFNPHSNAPSGRNIQFISTEWQVQNKRKKRFKKVY